MNSAIFVNVNKVNFAQRRKYADICINNVPGSPHINNNSIRLQIDSASDISIISKSNWIKLGKPGAPLDTKMHAVSATKHGISIIARFQCDIQLNGEVNSSFIYVTNIDSINLLGIDLIEMFNLWDKPLSSICCNKVNITANKNTEIARIQKQFSKLFRPELGICKKAEIKLQLKADVKPVFRPKRPVAYAVLPVIEKELQRLQDLGIISPVDHSEWAAPIVVAKKPNGSIRICGDYSTGLNANLEPHQYPLPVPEDIFAKLSGSTVFTQIDLSDAYLQVPVDEMSRKILTINTHKGLFTFNRVAPGIKSAPGAFQQIMDTMLSGLDGVAAYLDDIIVCGTNIRHHMENLTKVLQRLTDYGFALKVQKCSFLASEIKYLGHIIDKNGLRPDPAKIEKIKKMPAPKNVTELQSFIGAVNYYGKFVKKIRQLRTPLDQLLHQNTKWKWSSACQNSFEEFKNILESDLLLTHYDPSLPIRVAADASNVGIGAYIAHTFPDGSEKVVFHAARALTETEKKYSQIEKEALGLVFAVKKFHRFIYGRKFKLLTDHQPLLAIFGSKKGIPIYTANRLQRWALTLMLYNFEIEYISTNSFGFVDVLSRLINSHEKPEDEYIIACTTLETDIEEDLQNNINFLPLTYNMITKATQQSKVLTQVKEFIRNGWPATNKQLQNSNCLTELQQFFNRRESLWLINDNIMYGERLVIPTGFHKRVLRQLHRGHPGIQRMKAVARSYVYWPNIDQDIEFYVKQCHNCANAARAPVKNTLQSWSYPAAPMERIHVDIAGPCNDKYYFVIVDAFSKWPEIFQTSRITTSEIIEKLNSVFARYGNPKHIVSDNGTQFTSAEFTNFLQSRGINHYRTAPYHPQSNGQAERFVDTLKRALKKLQQEGTNAENLETFLQTYRSTPNRSAPQGLSPAELFLGRKIATVLDLLKPSTESHTTTTYVNKQNDQFNKHHGAKQREYKQGDLVYAMQFKDNKRYWVMGEVIEKRGSVNYNVFVDINGRKKLIRSHTNQLRGRTQSEVAESKRNTEFDIYFDMFNIDPQLPSEQVTASTSSPVSSTSTSSSTDEVVTSHHEVPAVLTPKPVVPPPETRTRSGRSVVKPERYRN